MMERPRSSLIYMPRAQNRRLQLRASERRALLRFGDVLAVVISIVVALGVWAFVARDIVFDLGFVLGQWIWFPVLIGLWLLLAGANDFYDLYAVRGRLEMFRRLLVIEVQVLFVYLMIFFLSPRDALPRLFILYYAVASVGFITVWRLSSYTLIGLTSEARRILLVGLDPAVSTLIDTLKVYARDSYHIFGVISNNEEHVGVRIGDIAVIGTADDMLNYIQRDRISELVLTSTRDLDADTFEQVMRAYEMGLSIVPMPLMYERLTGRVPVEHVRNNWTTVLQTDRRSFFDPYPYAKRIVDVALSIIGLAVFVVMLPFIAVAIRLDSPGGVFFSQKRTGLYGREFTIYKLRTMVNDAEAQTGAVFAQQNDPRITRVGHFLRISRLDELPQLWNILRGDMSLVGPRPERPEHVVRLSQKIPFYRTRLVVRPGLTGWAQVRYHYGATDDDALAKLEYDMWYIRHASLLLDVNIFLRTVGKVIALKGQ